MLKENRDVWEIHFNSKWETVLTPVANAMMVGQTLIHSTVSQRLHYTLAVDFYVLSILIKFILDRSYPNICTIADCSVYQWSRIVQFFVWEEGILVDKNDPLS